MIFSPINMLYRYSSQLTPSSHPHKSCGEEAAQAFPCTLPLEVLPDCEQNVMEVIKTLSEKCVTVKLLSKQDDARLVS